jgi:hypothetical protein
VSEQVYFEQLAGEAPLQRFSALLGDDVLWKTVPLVTAEEFYRSLRA